MVMKTYLTIIITLLSLFLASCQLSDESSFENKSSIFDVGVQGIVKDYDSKRVLSGVDVAINDTQVDGDITESDGSYRFDLVSDREYALAFSKAGYMPVDYDLKTSIQDEQQLETVYLVSIRTGSVGDASGIVTSRSTGETLEGVLLSLRRGLLNQNGEVLATTLSQADGSYIFSGVDAETYTVELSLEGYIIEYDTLYILGGENTLEQDFEMSPEVFGVDGDASFSGVVRDSVTNIGLNGVILSLREGNNTQTGAILGQTTSEGNATSKGSFAFSNLAVGPYTVEMSLENYITGYENILIKSPDDGNTTLYITPENITDNNTSVSGYISDFDNGDGLNGVTVSLREGNDTETGLVLMIDTTQTKDTIDGYYEFSGLVAGDYTVELSLDAYDTGFGNLTALDNEHTQDQNFTITIIPLVGDNNISGTIRDASNGNTLEGVALSLRQGFGVKSGGIVASGLSEDGSGGPSGSYTLEGLPAGEYTLEMDLAGYEISYGDIEVIDGESNSEKNFELSTELSSGEMRLLVKWIEGDPRDLDSYLYIETVDTTLNFMSPKNGSNQPHIAGYAILEKDETNGVNSPETIIIEDYFNGDYLYYIKKYSADGELIDSQATVTVIISGDETRIDMNTSGSGDYWEVLRILGGSVYMINEITETQPTLY